MKELPDWEEYESSDKQDDFEDFMPDSDKNSLKPFYFVVAVFIAAVILMVIFMAIDKSGDESEPKPASAVSSSSESTPEQSSSTAQQQDSRIRAGAAGQPWQP